MEKNKVALGELTLVGQTVRTNNCNEMDPSTAKIASTVGGYWAKQVAKGIKHRLTPGVTYSIYTDYASDEHGDYTYFIGELISSEEGQDLSNFEILNIPASQYQKFTTPTGAMPDIVINAWQSIWRMTDQDFGGKRKYIADFEIYDERAVDLSNAIVDIYVGI